MMDQPADPFGETGWRAHRKVVSVLGARVNIECNHRGLLALAERAFDGLPVHRLGESRSLRLVLKCAGNDSTAHWTQPPAPRLASGDGFLFSSIDPQTFALVAPGALTALVHVSPRALRFPYHVRYELIEFAGLTLSARTQRLIPLHAACFCSDGRAVLVLGDSGAGKSTLCLTAALAGFELLSEDSVFVEAESLLATGVANFLHLRTDGLKFVDDVKTRRTLESAPTIRRRSGVRKLEIDLRAGVLPVARRATRLGAVVVLSARRAKARPVLRGLGRAGVMAALRASQGYARAQPGWRTFERNIARLPGYLLERGAHPRDGAAALRDALRGMGR
jgi:energy-coupling factor transporter ATP-binding protein EcfA2